MTPRILISATALLAVAMPPAFAQTVVTGQREQIDDGSVSRVVRFGDLDIATPAGERILVRRVRGAVRYVCLYATDFSATTACESYAWNGAKPKLAHALSLARTNPSLAMGALATLTVSAPR